MNKKENSNSSEFLSWLIIFICFFAAWPLGLLLLLAKLGVIGKSRSMGRGGQRSANADLETRFRAYLRIVGGQNAMPIDAIASAAGVSYETALREVQQMLTLGRFGPEAYINYMTKDLILRSAAEAASGTASGGSAGASSGAAQKGTAQKGTAQKGGAQPANVKPYDPAGAEFRRASLAAKRYGGALRVLLLIFGILFAAGGGIGMLSLGAILAGLVPGYVGLLEFLFTVFIFTGGCSALFVRSHIKKRIRRFAIYMPLVAGRKNVELSVLAEAAGISESAARRDVEIMLEKGYFGPSAYINVGAGLLVLIKDNHEESKPEPVRTEEPADDTYSAILREIRELNDAILDTSVSERICRIEEITSKIFTIVQEKPEKLPQIKSFMSYYLPTTLKLLRSYSVFERQNIAGDTIDDAKKNIARILDSLVDGFSKQLDQLFISDAMDISTDINVLESMLKKDGFSGDGANFQVMGGH